jgi:hypothetical protein
VVARFIPEALAVPKTAGGELPRKLSMRREIAGEVGFFGIGGEMPAAD